jgi:hypothetical protein
MGTFDRISQRLKSSVQLLTQISNSQVHSQRVIEQWPDRIIDIADSLGEFSSQLRSHALEVDAFRTRQREETEALITLADSTANMATIVRNIKILIYSDPAYIYEMLTEIDPPIFDKALAKLSSDELQVLQMRIEAKIKQNDKAD